MTAIVKVFAMTDLSRAAPERRLYVDEVEKRFGEASPRRFSASLPSVREPSWASLDQAARVRVLRESKNEL